MLNQKNYARTVDREIIIVPSTVDELLDICANIARNVRASWEGETLSWMFPSGNSRSNADCLIFHNAGDMPFVVWTGKPAKSLFKDPESRGYHYAYRFGQKERVLKYPVLTGRGGDGYWSPTAGWRWIPVDKSGNMFTIPVTQFIGKRA